MYINVFEEACHLGIKFANDESNESLGWLKSTNKTKFV